MQSLRNPSTADLGNSDPFYSTRSVRRGAARQNGYAAETSLYAWFQAHSELASKIGFVACGVFYVLTAVYGIVAGGHSDTLKQTVASATNDIAIFAGFEVKAVRIDGRRHLPEAAISAALGPYKGLSIFSFDTGSARERLRREGWVAEARVMRLLPSTLVVELEENKPFALWSEGGKLAVIDETGRVLSLGARAEFPRLRVISGAGAAVPAKAMIDALAAAPELDARIQDIERIAGRRWDLVLDSGLRVKLPAEGFAEALADLRVIAAKNPAAFYEISEMDFRVPSQFTVRLKDESEIGRRKFLSWLSGA